MNRSADELHADRIIGLLDLEPHPEGGYFREVFRASRQVHSSDFEGPRDACTAIYFMLRLGEFSALHRVRSDEAWHHYAGAALELCWFSPGGSPQQAILGSDWAAEQRPLIVIPGGSWQAARPLDGSSGHDYALVGCTVAPGFEFADFEMPTRSRLLSEFPQHAALIERFTRD